jgi:hypothetical protein
VWEGMGRAVESASLSVGERMAVWEAVGVVGEVARIKCEWMCRVLLRRVLMTQPLLRRS